MFNQSRIGKYMRRSISLILVLSMVLLTGCGSKDDTVVILDGEFAEPEIFAEIDIEQDTRAFFQDYFGYSLTDEDLAQIFAADANADSQ